MENAPPKKLSIWAYPLIGVLLIICLPIIFAVWIGYLITSPFEKKRFRKSCYDELYPEYFWGITRTIHYKIYKKLREQEIPFEYERHAENGFDPLIIYILKKETTINFVLCDDLGGLHYCEEQKDWIYNNEFDDDNRKAEESNAFNPFELLRLIGENKYPGQTKNYLICMEKTRIGKMEIARKQKVMLRQDERFIDISYILTLTEKAKIMS